MRKVHLDFESRSRADIWKTGAYVYATHPSTEIMCLAYAVDKGPIRIIRREEIEMYPLVDPFEELRELAGAEDTLFYAHNALFEELIWEHKLEAFDLPRMPIKKWRCTAAKALACGLPKALKDVAAALNTGQQKDLGGRAVMLKVCKPKAKDGTWEEDPELIRQLEEYCAQDVATERDIDKALPELHPFEQFVWFEDQLINRRGMAVDMDAVYKCLSLIDEEIDLLKKQVFELSGGELDGVSRRAAVLKYFAKKGTVLPDFTKATVEAAIRSGEVASDLVEILRMRQQLGLTSTAKYKALKTAVCDDGRLRDTLLYHSASTGRWGGKLVQMQNLPRGTIKDTDGAIDLIKGSDIDTIRMMYGNVMGVLSSCVRGMFVAAPGHDLIVADYSAIEARVLMWFCGQADAVKMFADGEDIYVKMAERIGGGATRQLGKQAVLGCGYGMGQVKFQAVCQGYGIKVDESLSQKAVNAYRDTFSKVPSTWYAQERAMKTAIISRKRVVCGKVSWDWDAKGREFLFCTLPSGRRLAYHKAKVVGDRIKYMSTNSMTKKYEHAETYGGRIVENIIQAIARDIMAAAMLKVETFEWHVVLTVHDELVVEVRETANTTSTAQFIKLITETPAWAEGCPIDAEGWRGKRYKK